MMMDAFLARLLLRGVDGCLPCRTSPQSHLQKATQEDLQKGYLALLSTISASWNLGLMMLDMADCFRRVAHAMPPSPTPRQGYQAHISLKLPNPIHASKARQPAAILDGPICRSTLTEEGRQMLPQ